MDRRESLEGFDESNLGIERLKLTSVLSRRMEWESCPYLSEEDCSLLRELDGAPSTDVSAMLEDCGSRYANAFVNSFNVISSEEPLQYVLSMLEGILQGDKTRANIFNSVDVFSPLLGICTAPSYKKYTIYCSARVMGILLGTMDCTIENPEAREFLTWLHAMLRGSNSVYDSVQLLGALRNVFKSSYLQIAFIASNGVHTLSKTNEIVAGNTQGVYSLGFCFWMLSFHEHSFESFSKENIIQSICQSLKANSREKVARILLATLRNLCEQHLFTAIMIHQGFIKTLNKLAVHKWSDTDIQEDVEYLRNKLQEDLTALTTFEMYYEEVLSEKLNWSEVHTEMFWRENVLRFEEAEFRPLQKLIGLLNSDDDTTVAIACYDLGEFVRFYPGGRKVLGKLNGKSKLMSKMSHPSLEVQRHALLSVQKLMVTNWSFLQTK